MIARVRWSLLIPALALLAALCAVPLFTLLADSFEWPELTLTQFRRFVQGGAQMRAMGYTLKLSLTVTFICLVLGYPTAWLMTKLRGRARALVLAMVVAPYMTSLLVRTYAWVVMLGNDGVINSVLRTAGLSSPLKLLHNDIGVHIGMVHIMLPFMVLPLYSAMRQIDERLVSASLSLGAGPLTTFCSVYFPQSWPGVRSATTLVFVLCLGFFVTPAALGGPNNLTVAGVIEAQVMQSLDFAQGAAAAIVLLISTLTILRLTTIHRDGVFAEATRFDFARLRRRNWQRGLGRPARSSVWPFLLRCWVGTTLLFLVIPSLIMLPLSFNDSSFLGFPPTEWSTRWYGNFFTDRGWLTALQLSTSAGFAAAILAAACGTLAVLAMPRSETRAVRWITAAMLAPLIVPSIVLGIGIYRLFAAIGLLGTWTGLVLAHAVAGMGYVFLVVRATVAGVDPSLERAAASLGANRAVTFRRILLPLIAPGIAAGMLFAFMHSFDELVVTQFIAGFRLQTLPLKMWEGIRHTVDPTVAAVSSLLLLLTVIAVTFAGRTAVPQQPTSEIR